MKELIADPETADAKKMPEFVQKIIKDLHSESEVIKSMKIESKEFNEKEFLSNELTSIGKKEFGVETSVYSEMDSDIYDPKGKARHARPFKPAIFIEWLELKFNKSSYKKIWALLIQYLLEPPRKTIARSVTYSSVTVVAIALSPLHCIKK